MAGDSQQLSFHIALYVDQDTTTENQIQTVKAIAWSVQEADVNLKDLVRSPRELTFVYRRFCHTLHLVQITELGASLVSDNDDERSRAAQLLGQVTQLLLV